MLRATDGRPYGKVLRSDRGEPSPAEEFPMLIMMHLLIRYLNLFILLF